MKGLDMEASAKQISEEEIQLAEKGEVPQAHT